MQEQNRETEIDAETCLRILEGLKTSHTHTSICKSFIRASAQRQLHPFVADDLGPVDDTPDEHDLVRAPLRKDLCGVLASFKRCSLIRMAPAKHTCGRIEQHIS
eukprot:4727172-Pleurochrysis_carterae.AAC.1